MSSNRWKFRGLWEVVHHVMHELIINGIIDVRMPHWDPIKAEAGHFGIIRTRSSILRLKPVWIKPSAWLELDFPFELVDPIRKMEFLIEIVVSRSAIWGGGEYRMCRSITDTFSRSVSLDSIILLYFLSRGPVEICATIRTPTKNTTRTIEIEVYKST